MGVHGMDATVGLHLPEPPRGRHRPGAHRGRAAARGRSPTTRSGASSASVRSPGSTRSDVLITDAGLAARRSRDARGQGRPVDRRRCRRAPEESMRAVPSDEGVTDGLLPARRWLATRTAATTRSPTSGCWCRPGARSRPWLGAEEPEAAHDRPTYDPDCYLCPGNVRANGNRQPRLRLHVRLQQRLRGPAAGHVRGDASEHGLLRAEGERGTCRVVCFSPRHDLTLATMTPDADRSGRRPVGRADERARTRLPLGPGLREPRRGDGGVEPPSPRPDLGRRRRCRSRPVASRPARRRTSSAHRPSAAARLRRPGVGRAASRGRER